jgi:hypothetical protein
MGGVYGVYRGEERYIRGFVGENRERERNKMEDMCI